jgi:predicted MPP superfamily phosphohydrolase
VKRKLLKSLLKYSLFFLKQQKSLKKLEITVGKGNLDVTFLVLSDLHLNMHIKESSHNLKSLKNTEYDIGVILGDVFEWTYRKNHKQAIDLLSSVIKDSGKRWLAVMGNHDNEETRTILEKAGVKILENDWTTFNKISIFGFSDKYPDYKQPSEVNDAILYLSHRPDNLLKIQEVPENTFSIAGHTHGGQITVGKYIPVKNTQKKEMVYGHWTSGYLKGYTTSGFGYSGVPIRIGTQQEYVLLKY